MTATLSPQSGRYHRINRTRVSKIQPCEIPGCGQPANKKPYCIDHIENLDYIKQLMEKIAKENN